LRWRAYGESDKIVTFLTEDFGKLTGIGKGAQRSRRRFPNALEPLARVRMNFRVRPTSTLAFLESADLLHPASELADPLRFAYASYLAELVELLTVEEHPVRELYGLLDEALSVLTQLPASGALLRGFEVQLLRHSGYAPQLDHCAPCQRRLANDEAADLDVVHGTLCCHSCRAPGQTRVAVAPAVRTRLLALLSQPLAVCQPQALGSEADEAAAVTGRLLALHLPRPVRSLRLIEQLASATR
jgi:DNA repair protein RecO (recombination protein O)